MPSPLDIVLHTPLWVWPLLALVLWLGWSASRSRTVHPLRLAALPLVGLGVTIAGAVQSAMPPVTMASWLVGLLLSLPLGYAVGRRREVRWQDGRVWIAGGWFLLGFAVSIFVVRYALGVTFGIWPELARQATWIAAAGLVGGVIAGIGLGWLGGLLLRRRWFGRGLVAAAALPLLALATIAAVIAFSSPGPIQRLAAGDSLPDVDNWNWKALPSISKVTARDGAPLNYRLYPGRTDRAVVLVHGSSGSGISMHRMAQTLQKEGATVYAVSLRGHGGSGTVNGDTSYKAQLDDDLVDFSNAVGLGTKGIHRTLIGLSLGGTFVLRTASGANRRLFDSYLAISPYIAQDSPTSRPQTGGWTSVAVPRVTALAVLDGFGMPWFQGLPVVRYATDAAASENRTPVYSFRLLAGMQLHRNWRQEISSISQPTIVAVGANDELFKASEFKPLFADLNPKIAVEVLPDQGHLDMVSRGPAVETIAKLWLRLSGGRLDLKVREDMFAGFDGDKEALERAMKLVEDTLARDPNQPQALAWRGAGRVFLAGQAFGRGDMSEGLRLAGLGFADLDRGVALQPNTSTRAVRGPVLLIYADGARRFDKQLADRLTRTAIVDYEVMMKEQVGSWSTLDEHDRGELLGGLAAGWLQMGDTAKATPYLDRMIGELPGTPYARNATLRRADPSAKTPVNCLGCH